MILLQNIQTLEIRTCDSKCLSNTVLHKFMIFEQTKNPLSHIDLKGSEPIYLSSEENGSNAMIRDNLIAEVNLRWYFALVPVTRRGRIFPRSDTNFLSKSTSL